MKLAATNGFGIYTLERAMIIDARDSILEVTNVNAGYGDTQILNDISFDVAKGERLAVTGRNGAGKSTLLNTIMGLTDLHSGNINLRGMPVHTISPNKRALSGLGLVPQTRDIFSSLSVEENLLAGIKDNDNSGNNLDEAYELFPRLKERRKNAGSQLSGGEQQMLSIARTLMGRPEILMLDEPLEGLAPVLCEMLMEVFVKLGSSGEHTIILVEQHMELALEFSDRMLILDNGEIVFHDQISQIRSDPSILERHIGLGMSNA